MTPPRVTERPGVRLEAANRLQALRAQAGSWGRLAASLGENKGMLWLVAHGARPAPHRLLIAIGLERRRPRVPWKRMFEQVLCAYVEAMEERGGMSEGRLPSDTPPTQGGESQVTSAGDPPPEMETYNP